MKSDSSAAEDARSSSQPNRVALAVDGLRKELSLLWYATPTTYFRHKLGDWMTRFRNKNPGLYHLRNKPFYPAGFDAASGPILRTLKRTHHDLFPESDIRTWLDRDDALEVIEQRLAQGELSEHEAEACRKFQRDGYYVARGLFSADEVDAAFQDYDQAVQKGHIELNSNRRNLNPHFVAHRVDRMIRDERIMAYNRLFLGEDKIIPFQSIGSHYGSEQLEHSDAIHMTTYPLGFLAAAWVSCDDVTKGSGELMYYPGSHRLPYYLSKDVGFHPREYFTKSRQYVYHELYEPFLQNVIKERGMKPEYFYSKKGDVLFWHHNLIHGGSPITDHQATRRAFVFHYFTRSAVNYHEVFGGLADVRL